MTRNRLPIAAALAGALALTGPANAQDLDFSSMDAAERQAFGQAVRDYLLENPQVIMEAVAVLEAREAQAQDDTDAAMIAANAGALFDDGFSWVGGNPEGSVTVVEFMDYRCGYCRRASPEVDRLLASDDDVRLIVKEFPILGEASMVSSRFAIATLIVAGDDAYKAVHDALMVLDTDPSERVLRRLAGTLDLDADAILAEMDSAVVTDRIRSTRALAQTLQISGTPTFVVGDRMLRGYAPLDVMQGIVADQRG